MNLSKLGLPETRLCTSKAPLFKSSFSSSSRASDKIELERKAYSGIFIKLPFSDDDDDDDDSSLFAVFSSSSIVPLLLVNVSVFVSYNYDNLVGVFS